MNLTYTNIVLKVGGQILLLVIGIMAITFGIESDWPSKNVDKMFSTTSITGVNTKTVKPITNAIRATAVAVAVTSAKKNTVSSTEPEAKPISKSEAKPDATVPAKTAANPKAIKTVPNPKATVKTNATAAAVASTIYKKLLEKRKAAAAAK